MFCKKCSKTLTEGNRYGKNGSVCLACYNYYRNGGTDNIPPKPGTIEYDKRGCVICHICGRAYKRLGSHIKETHNMSIKEYKEKFGLCNNAKTTEAVYSKMMHDHAYKNGMPERLKITGRSTQIKKGENDKRKGKPIRLQERLQHKNHMIGRAKTINN